MDGDVSQIELDILETDLDFLPGTNSTGTGQPTETGPNNGKNHKRSREVHRTQSGKARKLPYRHIPPQSDGDRPKYATKESTRTSNREEEDTFVETLRSQKLPWKDISEMFFKRFGKTISAETLQMRRLRRKRNTAAWSRTDVSPVS